MLSVAPKTVMIDVDMSIVKKILKGTSIPDLLIF